MSSTNRTNWHSIRAINLPGKAWPQSPVARAMLQGIGAAMYGASKGAEFLRDVASEVGVSNTMRTGGAQALSNSLASIWPVKSLQIGVIDAGDWAASLVASQGVMDTQWLETTSEALAASNHTSTLDAMLRMTDRSIELTTMLHASHEAGITDWVNLPAQTSGAGFAQLFPLRQDCLRLSLDRTIAAEDFRCARLLIEAATLLARHPARTALGDRLAGRAANWSDNNAGQASLNAICTALQSELETTSDLSPLSTTRSIAAHMLSQWAATSPTMTQAQRLEVAELCAKLLPSDAFATLRLAAVRFAQLDDAGGIDALADASHALKHANARPLTDQTPFLLAELESGFAHPLSLGRIAAGITLAASTLSAADLKVYRDELRDELKYSRVLIERDQDRFLIDQVFTMLAEQAHGFASTIEPQESFAPTLAFRAASQRNDRADEGAELVDDEVNDNSPNHGFQSATSLPSNPWQALIAPPTTKLKKAKRAASAKSLRLTGARTKQVKPISKSTTSSAKKSASKSTSKSALKSKRRAA